MHGYSSSSESDDDYRRKGQPVPVQTNANDATKKKKKRKPPPQRSINQTWKRFSNKQFNKALSVLPFDPVPPPAVSEHANELLSAGYEKAAEECRRKVKKIIQECRRVNMRYRDPGWDLVSFPPRQAASVHLGVQTFWHNQSPIEKPMADQGRRLTRICRTGISKWRRETA